VPPVEWPWEVEEQGSSPAPVEDPGNHDIDREEGEDRIRCQETQRALDPCAYAPELREHPSNPVAALRQVDNDQSCENQPHVCMDGIADVKELQGPQCRRDGGEEAKVHEPARPGTWRATLKEPPSSLTATVPKVPMTWPVTIRGIHTMTLLSVVKSFFVVRV
jgi:hypothetical protein